MCERCVFIAAAVDEAVVDESLSRVCSFPECRDTPVARYSSSDDDLDLLCVDHLSQVAVAAGVSSLTHELVHSGAMSSEAQMGLVVRAHRVFSRTLEVLS